MFNLLNFLQDLTKKTKKTIEPVKQKIEQAVVETGNRPAVENLANLFLSKAPAVQKQLLNVIGNVTSTAKQQAQNWIQKPSNQLFNATVAPAAKAISKAEIYNPETKRIFPQSLVYQENTKLIDVNQGKVQANPNLMNIVLGLTGNVSKVDRLRNLMTYQNKLRDVGFLPYQIEKISAPEAARIFKEKIMPFEHPTFGSQYKGEPKIDFAATQSEAQRAGDVINIHQALEGGGNLLNRAKGLPEEVRNIFSDWVNARRTTEIQGVKAKLPFTQLDKGGLETFFKTQEGATGGAYDTLRNFFDTRWQQVKDTGLDLGYKKSYLPQLWKNPKDEVEEILGRTLTQKPSFSLESLIKDYKTGVEKGLTPRFNKLSDLVGWYESYAQKTIADRRFFDRLTKSKLVLPSNHAPDDWVTLADTFPKFKLSFPTGERYSGNFKAPEALAKMINNYLEAPAEVLQKAAQFTTKIKNVALSSGIPTTSINAHGFNLATRYILSSKNPALGIWHGIEWTLAPGRAAKFVNQRLDQAEFFTKNGLSLSTEDQAYTRMARDLNQNLLKQGYNKVADIQEKLFEDPLFRKTASAYKLDIAGQIYKDFTKSGMAAEEAAKKASSVANNFFGGINIEELGRDKNLQNILRTTILAPDWAETTIRTGKGIVTSLNPKNWFKPEFGPYRIFVRNLMLALTSTNIVNKALSGHWQFQNEPGHEVEIDTGTYTADGKKRYLRPFGTGIDFLRLPIDIASGIIKGNPDPIRKAIANRLSMPAGATLHMATNTDYLQRPIWGNDRYGNPLPVKQQVGSVLNEVATGLGVPQYLRAGVDVATGKSNPEQGVTQALELPFRYTGGAYSKAQQQGKELTGAKGKELFDLNTLLRGQTQLSENQARSVKQGAATIPDILNLRTATKKANEEKPEIPENIKQLRYETTQRTDKEQKAAEKIWGDIKDLSYGDQVKKLNELKQAGTLTQTVYTRLKAIKAEAKKGMTAKESQVYNLSPEEEAAYHWSKIKDMNRDEQLKYLNDLKKRGLLTQETYKELQKLKAK